ncbi:hypothetical protein DERP_004677 [Dermatophagoides pteronyssinus]|uniref:Uncharacterized protein n=1 Tax=Dermatophagoides pteronyssinus TaxID=6956 RepID=A0ABQ8JPG8_DERPT|nr:hypothetical protein DERP_004677 [Dermatophagoides pteronyssinus]
MYNQQSTIIIKSMIRVETKKKSTIPVFVDIQCHEQQQQMMIMMSVKNMKMSSSMMIWLSKKRKRKKPDPDLYVDVDVDVGAESVTVIDFFNIKYAITNVDDREIPSPQCTRIFPFGVLSTAISIKLAAD